ncbi:MAG TPA: hypothetical protein VMF13_19890 [Luteitalea sp.]|nr:hypothetical protein [Luteitalea sp.]
MPFETRITEAAQSAVRRLDEALRTRLATLEDELRAAASEAATEATASHAEAIAALDTQLTTLKDELASRAAELSSLKSELDVRDQRFLEIEEQRAQDRESQALAVTQLRQEADAALGEAERALAEAVRQAQLHDDQREQHRAALAEVTAASDGGGAERVQKLASAVSAMDQATTLSEVLDALSDGLLPQVPRSAVLVFQQDRARIWRRSGFPADAPGLGTELHLPDYVDLKAIVDSAAPAIVDGQDDAGPVLGLAALPSGRQGLAVPVAIGGQSAALVYADGGDDGVLPAGWADVVEVLARHAARCLETLTAMRAAGYARAQRAAVVVPMPPHLRVVQRPVLDTPMGDALDQARRVARLLVSEIRLNREADVMEGRAQGDLGARLSDDIDRARRTYQQRVNDALPGRDALFDEEVLRTLANGDAALLKTGS